MVQIPRFRQIKIPKLKSTHDAITFSYNLEKHNQSDIGPGRFIVKDNVFTNKNFIEKLKGLGSKIGVNYGNSFTVRLKQITLKSKTN